MTGPGVLRRLAPTVCAVLLLPACAGSTDSSAGAAREIAISANDELRFVPSTFTAKPGEKVVLVVSNPGRLDHELAIGDAAYLDSHAEGGDHADHASATGASVSVLAGKTARLTFSMPDGEAPSFACYVDRHDRAGMTGTVTYT